MFTLNFIGRHLGLSSRKGEEKRFEKVAVGKGYLGKLSEEWFDVANTPTHSDEMTSTKPESKSSTPSASESNQRRSVARSPSSQPSGPSAADASPSEKPRKYREPKGKQKQYPTTPSTDQVQEMLPVLIKLFHLGQEMVPLLVTLAKVGEDWSRNPPTSIVGGPDGRSWPATGSGKATPQVALSEAPSDGAQDDAQLTPTASHTTAEDSRSKTPKSTETAGNSTLAPSASPSQETDEQSCQSVSRSKEKDAEFESFKKLCSTHGFLQHPMALGEHDVCDGINDEPTLRRFFDARKRDVVGAHRQFQEAWDARKANNLCAVYERIGIAEFQETRNLYPAWCGRRDKAGQPICLFDFGKLDTKTMAAYRKSSADMKYLKSELEISDTISMEMLRAFAVYEHLTRFIMPLCTAVRRRPDPEIAVTKMLCIVDISGIGLKQVWNLRHYLQDLSKLFATSYPEVLSRVLIIGAPSYFPTIWGWIKKWVDPNTMEKLCILSQEEVLSTLQQYVETANIPKRFGGHFDHYHGMQPSLDPIIADMLSWQPPKSELPEGPMKWVDEGWGKRAAVAVGSSGGHVRNAKIAVLRPKRSVRK